MSKMVPVVVTSSHRDLTYGWTDDPVSLAAVGFGMLHRARSIRVYRQPPDAPSLSGLARVGPDPGSEIGPEAPGVICRDIVNIWLVSPEAAERFAAVRWVTG